MARTKESKAKAHPPSGNRKYSSRGDNSLDKFISSNGQIYGTLTLDTRRELSDGLYPVAIRVAFNGKNLYLRIGDRYTLDDWTALCECEKQGKRLGITVFQPRLKVCTFAHTNYYEHGKQRQVQESP